MSRIVPLVSCGKAYFIACMTALRLAVPPAIVVTTETCAACLAAGGLPDELAAGLTDGIAWLEQATGRRFG